MTKQCELCEQPARMYCESDQASLCWECDARVHGANFLVARHSRSLLCRSCQAPTPWQASGSWLGPTVSVCEACLGGGGGGGAGDVSEKGEMGGVGGRSADGGRDLQEEEEDDEGGEDEEDEDEGEGEGEEEDEDGENQVVPLSMQAGTTTTATAPSVASCSSSEESSSGRPPPMEAFPTNLTLPPTAGRRGALPSTIRPPPPPPSAADGGCSLPWKWKDAGTRKRPRCPPWPAHRVGRLRMSCHVEDYEPLMPSYRVIADLRSQVLHLGHGSSQYSENT